MDTNEIREYQTIAACLLKKHFGLTLNDTNLHDDAVVLALIKRGVPAFEAINQLVEKYHLDRTDQNAWSPQSPLLNQSHFLVAVLDIVPEKILLVCINETNDKLTQH
ncbi:hypothetical protein YKD1_07960 [Yersinia pseudotuberculosis]|uniref:TA system toxin CbtA family protein n=2 Tax=Yersinia pseudotuberculosis complex TaxID=1649845 RepID=UPI0038B536C7